MRCSNQRRIPYRSLALAGTSQQVEKEWGELSKESLFLDVFNIFDVQLI